ncbi:dipeptidyl aminopeptidase [Amanita rubescens]|nr:dipeptidyl aminopeptidase [Amanita rubescens]KAF8336235.1 dipeptidyl aminopeptidase [Amanita rubescens]
MRSSSYERIPDDQLGQVQESRPVEGLHYTDDERPPIYYGEGPFDPPSSEDESTVDDKEGETQATGEVEDDDVELQLSATLRKKPSSLRVLVISLAALVCLAGLIGIIAASAYSGAVARHGSQKITMNHVFNGTFYAESHQLQWVPQAGDGVISYAGDGRIELVDFKTNTTNKLVAFEDIRDEHGRLMGWSNWHLSSDMKFVLLKTDYKKQWRHSSFGNYYVHEIETKKTYPLIPPTDPPTTAYAAWSPTGNSIAYVTNNDLYILPYPSSSSIRITISGNASLFHGVPDWVYEEEVLGGNSALWWSPDSSKVAFLALDETLVDEYKFPIYNPSDDSNAIYPYTTDVVMKYPKPGYDNPLVSVHVFDLERYLANDDAVIDGLSAPNATLSLDWSGRQKPENSIVQEVAWVDNSTLIIKEVNRNANDGSVILFDLDATTEALRSSGTVVRKLGQDGEEGDAGWIENRQFIYPLPPNLGYNGYLDVIPDPQGYDHIALFSPASSDTPRFLTSEKWEVTSNIKAINVEKKLIYFEAANPGSTQRHLFSVPLPSIISSQTVKPTALTDVDKVAYYSSSFSPQGGFYQLSYLGPDIPWAKVLQINNRSFEFVLATNERLGNITKRYEAATVIHSTIMSDGYELNVKEMRPPRMDDSGRTKYPVLFRVYGGPQSQLVDVKFNRDWHDYLVCGLQYIVVVVDGRGTGFKGRKLRNPVKGNLGYWETIDQINAARIWAGKNYVDPKRIGIWGWSYGGFMSSKVVEADAGIHSLAIAVAPVTSWRLYDSIYTERYMDLPDLNPGGYVNASISNVTGFKNVDFLLAHGSGDDNVHFANSAHLLDMFTGAGVRSFRFRMFTDSDHSINRRGAQRELYEYMTDFLVEKWGKGGRRRRW